MKYAPIISIPNQTAGTVNGTAIPTESLLNASAQIITTGSAGGTLKFQASNDNVTTGTGQTPTNWSDIASATVTVSAAGVQLIPNINLCYQWIRVVYTNTGTGTMQVNVKVIGF